jgi:hypothetical protein
MVDGVTLRLAQPMDSFQEWIGEREILKQLLACWLVIDQKDLPLSPRITGPPGIGQSRYGGALFLFPPRPIPNIWQDARLNFARTLEERLIAGGALDSLESHIALVSPIPPLTRWRQIARQFHRRLVPIPLSRFSAQTFDRLRRFHVLNGHEIRSYAARFIR